MKRLIAALLLISSLGSFGQGTLRTITFEGPPGLERDGTSRRLDYYMDWRTYLMFWQPESWPFGSLGQVRGGGWTEGFYPNNGTTYLGLDAGGAMRVSFEEPSLFGLRSVDLAGWSTVYPDFNAAFVGYRQDGTTVTAQFAGSGINFQTFYFGPEFSALSYVEINNAGEWWMDNLVISVPEPASGSLLVCGVAVAVAFRRRKASRGSGL